MLDKWIPFTWHNTFAMISTNVWNIFYYTVRSMCKVDGINGVAVADMALCGREAETIIRKMSLLCWNRARALAQSIPYNRTANGLACARLELVAMPVYVGVWESLRMKYGDNTIKIIEQTIAIEVRYYSPSANVLDDVLSTRWWAGVAMLIFFFFAIRSFFCAFCFVIQNDFDLCTCNLNGMRNDFRNKWIKRTLCVELRFCETAPSTTIAWAWSRPDRLTIDFHSKIRLR